MASKVSKKKTNDLALLGLVFSIFIGLPGVILSIIGLNQIKKTGQSGKGFAISGIIVGILNTLFVVIAIVFLVMMLISGGSIASLFVNVENMSDYEKCNSAYTDCVKSDWYCENYGCYCSYDDGYNYDYFYCDSYDFD